MPESFEVRVVMDVKHQPLAVVVVARYADGREVVWPTQPGPFDTAQEAFEAVLAELDKQLTLW